MSAGRESESPRVKNVQHGLKRYRFDARDGDSLIQLGLRDAQVDRGEEKGRFGAANRLDAPMVVLSPIKLGVVVVGVDQHYLADAPEFLVDRQFDATVAAL